jgi:hypothetical protein
VNIEFPPKTYIDITSIFSDLLSLSKKCTDESIKEIDEFNFFSAIITGKDNGNHIEFYHSNFMANLLNPKGSYGCGSLFLNELLFTIRESQPSEKLSKFLPIDTKKDFIVDREKAVNGNIDIYIESEDKWILFIENKINSKEGKNQLKDYCGWISENRQNCKLLGIYLTKRGSQPEYFAKETEYKNSVICLGYDKVIQWLEKCAEKIRGKDDSCKVYCGVIQCIMVVKEIVNMDMKYELEKHECSDETLEWKMADKSYEISGKCFGVV